MAEIPTVDRNGEMVHRFALTMNNLGLAKAAHELETMLASKRWQRFTMGGQTFQFLPGEFDYFLSQEGVTREQVMAIRDVDVKARLEAAMDERRTGETKYRRTITEVRAAVPERPGNPIEPYGYTAAERKALAEIGTMVHSRQLPALGSGVRRYAIEGTTKAPSEQKPRWERLAVSVCHLPDDELTQVAEAITAEMTRRQEADRG